MKLQSLAKIAIFVLIGWLVWKGAVAFFGNKRQLVFVGDKQVVINDNGLIYQITSDAKNIAELIEKQKIVLAENDLISPRKEERLRAGTVLEIWRNHKVKIKADGEKIERNTFAQTVEAALRDAGIQLGRLDKVKPAKEELLTEREEIVVTRINIEKLTVMEEIEFKVIEKENRKLRWRKEVVEQAGEEGEKKVEYEVKYKNGKEVSRKILSSKTVKKPVNKVVTVGTKVKLGKTHTGWGTWYDQGPHPKLRARYPFKGEMFAASPWLPLGSYAKVTNKANGRSVIVRINDRGPFGANRIIDLHKPAFTKIASLGAGVLDVKVEEILQ